MSINQPSVPGRLLRPSLSAVVAALLVLLALVAPATAVSGPTKLSDPAVAPRAAVPGETIIFAVTYRNREGSPPDEVRVTVHGSTHLMAPTPGDDAWKQGVRFAFSTTLPIGTHAVTFSATDREKFTDAIDAGVVTVASPPAVAPTPVPTPAPPATGPVATPAPASGSGSGTASPTVGSPTTANPDGPDGAGGSSADGADLLAPPRPSSSANDAVDPADPASPADHDPTTPEQGGLPGAPGAASGPGSGGNTADPDGPAPPSGVGRAGAPASGGWGDLARALESLGIDAGRNPLIQVLPTVVGTAGGVTMLMAFMFLGKKRRDGEPPAPDEVLHSNAARGSDLPRPAQLVDAELALPRWRRPSLLEARKTDPLRDTAAPPPSLSFDHGLVGPIEGCERRIIRYHVVRLLDAPDELRSAEIGFLDQGDEVQLLERSGTYWLVLCPDGRRGWLHKMTLGDVVGESPAPSPRETWATSGTDPEPAVDDDVLTAFLAARGRA